MSCFGMNANFVFVKKSLLRQYSLRCAEVFDVIASYLLLHTFLLPLSASVY